MRADEVKVGEVYAYGRAINGAVCGKVRIEAECEQDVKVSPWNGGGTRKDRGFRVTYLTSYSNVLNREGFLARRQVAHDLICTWAEWEVRRDAEKAERAERDAANIAAAKADAELRDGLLALGVAVSGGHEDGGRRPFTIEREELVKLLARLQEKE